MFPLRYARILIEGQSLWMDGRSTLVRRWARLAESEEGGDYKIEPSQGDGWKITTPHGYIDYRHRPEDSVNEIWWVESHKQGHGSELVHLMQKHHPAGTIAWGVTSRAGNALMHRWHKANPDIGYSDYPHEGQFDPYGYDDDVYEESRNQNANVLVEMPVRIPQWFTRDFTPDSPPDEYKAVTSRHLGNGFYHHAYDLNGPYRPRLHLLSTSPTPPVSENAQTVIGSATVHRVPFERTSERHRPELADWTGKPVSIIKFLAIHPALRRQKLGKLLYHAIAANDERVLSDKFVAPDANFTWNSLQKSPQLKVSLAPYGWFTRGGRHAMEYISA